MVDYVENYWYQECSVKVDLQCAPDCIDCCKQPCDGSHSACGGDSVSSSLSSADEYVLVPKNLIENFD